jgi:hypothetical protein
MPRMIRRTWVFESGERAGDAPRSRYAAPLAMRLPGIGARGAAVALALVALASCTSGPQEKPSADRVAAAPGDWSAQVSAALVERVEFDPRGDHVLVEDELGALVLLDAATGALQHVLHAANDVDVLVPRACFSADGKLVAWSVETEAHATIFVADTDSGAERAVLPLDPADRAVCFAFTSRGPALFVGRRSGSITAFDVQTGASSQEEPAWKGLLRSLVFSDDGTQRAVITRAGDRDCADVQDLTQPSPPGLHGVVIEASAFTGSGFLLLQKLVPDASAFLVFPLGSTEPPMRFDRSASRVTRAAFSPDGSRVALACADGSLELWDWRHAQRVATLALDDFVCAARANFLAGIDARGAIAVADLEDGAILESLELPEEGDITAIALDPAARRVACGTEDGRVLVWLLAH